MDKYLIAHDLGTSGDKAFLIFNRGKAGKKLYGILQNALFS